MKDPLHITHFEAKRIADAERTKFIRLVWSAFKRRAQRNQIGAGSAQSA